MRFGRECSHQPQAGGRIREDADYQGAPLDFFHPALEHVGRFQILVMLPWQTIEAECFFNVLFHPGAELGIPFAPLQQPSRQVLARFLGAATILDPAQLLQTIVVCLAWQRVERIAQEVNLAALPHGLRQCFWKRTPQARMIVADHELHSVQRAVP